MCGGGCPLWRRASSILKFIRVCHVLCLQCIHSHTKKGEQQSRGHRKFQVFKNETRSPVCQPSRQQDRPHTIAVLSIPIGPPPRTVKPAIPHPWAPNVLFLPQTCNALSKKPYGILYGLTPACLHDLDHPQNSIASNYRSLVAVSKHIHQQCAPFFLQSEQWCNLANFHQFHTLFGLRISNYSSMHFFL